MAVKIINVFPVYHFFVLLLLQLVVAESNASAKLVVDQSGNLQPDVVCSRLAFQDYFYLAKIGLGTFVTQQPNYRNYFLIVDTSADLIWTQCEPCKVGFNQTQPVFPYSKSKTYRLLKCNSHSLCYRDRCQHGYCTYGIRYVGNQSSTGYLGIDRFTFELDNGAIESVDGLVFGCGDIQENFKYSSPNIINGILGMGTGPRSLISQLGNRAQGCFSYCVPSWKNSDNIFLRFGKEAKFQPGLHVLTTPFIKGQAVQTYYVRLLDISVAGNRLNFPPGYFDIRQNGTGGGCVIDSGSPFTVLLQAAYTRVRDAVISYWAQMHLPVKQKPGADLCYQVPRPGQQFPPIIFHFFIADLIVRSGAFLHTGDAICFAFKSSGGLGGGISAIIGDIITTTLGEMAVNKIVLCTYHFFVLLLLQFVIANCSNGFSLKLIHRYSEESPLYPGNLTPEERVERLQQQTDARLNYYHACARIADAKVVVDDEQFGNLQPEMDDYCAYVIKYLTNQTSVGFLAIDRFAFELENGGTEIIDGLVFGCGHKQLNFKINSTQNQINGILGMGTGPCSLINQLGNRAQSRFSYCIPLWKNTTTADNIFLRFGNEAKFRQGQLVHTTPFTTRKEKVSYDIKVLDISVAGDRLHFPPGYFDIKHDGTGGCFIDSGSPYSVLPEVAYTRVKSAVVSYWAHMQLPMKQKPGQDLCFQVPRRDQGYPEIIFHFLNADLSVESGALFHAGDAICFAFKSSGGVSLIGGHAQSDYRLGFCLISQPRLCLLRERTVAEEIHEHYHLFDERT
ncbi:Aspartyl protease family protein [Thalictrum thalictroides]|uniref:Aspartyl protease family protein n=1 Tax=Thalictrum thalictroides TaxID=46969 RepID=A0A7J6VA47_THATH|nr:Aspartyl protease family protein [Thalictrum thalictroides]